MLIAALDDLLVIEATAIRMYRKPCCFRPESNIEETIRGYITAQIRKFR